MHYTHSGMKQVFELNEKRYSLFVKLTPLCNAHNVFTEDL